MKFNAALPTQREVEKLYKRVQQKDKQAEDQLIIIHRILYQHSPLNRITRGEDKGYRTHLHTIYLHIHRHPSIK